MTTTFRIGVLMVKDEKVSMTNLARLGLGQVGEGEESVMTDLFTHC